MMTELCQELRNWFDRGQKKWTDETITISGGELVGYSGKLQAGQYYRLIGSVFNDGVHEYGDTDLTDETFTGSVWAMTVPPAVIALSSDIDSWIAKYGSGDAVARSPFNSESFGGYSYSKSAGGSSGDFSGSKGGSWKAAFAYDLNRWRKI